MERKVVKKLKVMRRSAYGIDCLIGKFQVPTDIKNTKIEKNTTGIWTATDGQSRYTGKSAGELSGHYLAFIAQEKELVTAMPIAGWLEFKKDIKKKEITLEEAEEKMKLKDKFSKGPGKDKEDGDGKGPKPNKPEKEERFEVQEGNEEDTDDERFFGGARKNPVIGHKKTNDDKATREDLDYDINEQFDDDEEVEDRIVANVEEDVNVVHLHKRNKFDMNDEIEDEGQYGLSRSGTEMYKILEKAKPKAENEEEDSDLFGESSEDDYFDSEEEMDPVPPQPAVSSQHPPNQATARVSETSTGPSVSHTSHEMKKTHVGKKRKATSKPSELEGTAKKSKRDELTADVVLEELQKTPKVSVDELCNKFNKYIKGDSRKVVDFLNLVKQFASMHEEKDTTYIILKEEHRVIPSKKALLSDKFS